MEPTKQPTNPSTPLPLCCFSTVSRLGLLLLRLCPFHSRPAIVNSNSNPCRRNEKLNLLTDYKYRPRSLHVIILVLWRYVARFLHFEMRFFFFSTGCYRQCTCAQPPSQTNTNKNTNKIRWKRPFWLCFSMHTARSSLRRNQVAR